jgi:Eukaryotic aspartyl protease
MSLARGECSWASFGEMRGSMAKTAKKATVKRARVLSAAATLGGKISATTVRIPITNVFMDGDYTGSIQLGSEKTPLNVILDTGSSTLAVDGHRYNVTKDKSAVKTKIAQEVGYADNSSWIGGVVTTDVTAGIAGQSVVLPKVDVAVAYHETANMFGKSDGILGLAYTRLNNAYTMPGLTIPPKYTYNQIQAGQVTYLTPYFTQLEEAGLVANKFAFYTKRSEVSMATKDPASDPLNSGFLILGGGEESTDLYTGKFQVARVVDDLYYNTNLKAVIVGDAAPIPVPPPTKASGNTSNSVVDSGTNGLLIDQTLFEEIAKKFTSAADATLTDAIRAGYVSMSALNLSSWPTITFVLEGALGVDVKLEVTADAYWQTNSPRPGYASASIYGDDGQGKGQSILGLPLMSNYFTVFDRSVEKGLGVVSFAPRK